MIQQEPVDNRNVETASIVELYSVYVQMIEKVFDRREDTNKFFITLLTGLLALLSIIIELRGTAFLQQEALLIVGVVGILLCYIWRILLRGYQQLNAAKHKTVRDAEKRLPFAFYTVSKKYLERDNYRSLSRVEQNFPTLFGILYTLLLAGGVYLLITGGSSLV